MSRRVAREVAFRALFQVEVGKCGAAQAIKRNLEDFKISDEERQFAEDLVSGTLACLDELDAAIARHLINWELMRLSAVERNLIRLAMYEIESRPDIPFKVSINEALELAKKYGSSSEAVGFINGVLDRAAGKNSAD